MQRKYTWRKDLPDHRDVEAKYSWPFWNKLPKKVSLANDMPPIYDQESTGSCTANAVGALHEYMQMREKSKLVFQGSRMFTYYNTRMLEGTGADNDAGGTIRGAMKSIAQYGICPESMWAYTEDNFPKKPPKECYDFALNHQAIKYYRILQIGRQLRASLADGIPVAFGFSVFSSFEDFQGGILQKPGRHEEFLGGHAVVLIGYDETEKSFLVRNSWGRSFAESGNFRMAADYVLDPNLSADFWACSDVEGPY